MRILFKGLLLLLPFFLMSCSNNPSSSEIAADLMHRQNVEYIKKDSNVNPQQVSLYKADQKPLTPYRVIGVATVSKYNFLGRKRHEETVHNMIKNVAAAMGGDAVINMKSNGEKVSAKVIQFQKILL